MAHGGGPSLGGQPRREREPAAGLSPVLPVLWPAVFFPEFYTRPVSATQVLFQEIWALGK